MVRKFKEEEIYVYILSDSICSSAKTNTIVKQLCHTHTHTHRKTSTSAVIPTHQHNPDGAQTGFLSQTDWIQILAPPFTSQGRINSLLQVYLLMCKVNIWTSTPPAKCLAMPYKWWLLLLHSFGEGIRLIWGVKWSVYFYLKNFTRGVYLKPLLCSLHHSRRISLRFNITDRVFLWVAVQGPEESILYHKISQSYTNISGQGQFLLKKTIRHLFLN